MKTEADKRCHILLLFVTLSVKHAVCHFEEDPKLLLVSLDGFRWDYLSKGSFPNFTSIIQNGVESKLGVKNAFLTKTFPNHYTIVTGLYEESHGIVGNVIFDPHFNETFHIENKTQEAESKWFDDGGEPVWVTNQKFSTSRRSGSIFWPGDRAAVKGFLPYRHLPYDGSMSFRTRIDKIISWFVDEYPINLGLLYYEEPDRTGHEFGPDSPEIIEKIKELDGDIGYLINQLLANHLLGEMNIIITSDHGMTSTPTDEEHEINLDKYLNLSSYDIDSVNPVGTIRPKPGMEDEIYNNLSSVPHLHVYRKEEIPAAYHYTNNRRIDAILAEPDEHYWISSNNSRGVPGEHGYNNSLKSMHPFFIAVGPQFKSGASVEIFNNVDIYPLMCQILRIPDAPNNGSLSVVDKLLRKHKSTVDTFWAYIVIIIFIGLIGGIFSIAACRVQRQHRRRLFQLRTLSDSETSFRYRDLNNSDKVPLVDDTSEDEFDVP